MVETKDTKPNSNVRRGNEGNEARTNKLMTTETKEKRSRRRNGAIVEAELHHESLNFCRKWRERHTFALSLRRENYLVARFPGKIRKSRFPVFWRECRKLTPNKHSVHFKYRSREQLRTVSARLYFFTSFSFLEQTPYLRYVFR